MTWLIGCPKSRGALINHLTDWIQSSASPAQWWTGKDTAQVLTRVHSHHLFWQRRRRGPTGQKNERTHTEERGDPLPAPLSMSSGQSPADRRHRFCHLIITKRMRKRGENNDRKWMWRRRFDGRLWDIHPYWEGRKMMQVSAGVGGLYAREDLDMQLHF